MDAWDYALPSDRIAQRPLEQRDESRLLVLDRTAGSIEDARFMSLSEWLDPGDLLVVNDTAVFPARLFARRPTGGRVEILLVRALDDDSPEEAAGRVWRALVRPGRKARRGDALELLTHDGARSGARIIVEGRTDDGARIVRFDVPGDPRAWIAAHGHVPLPPYIVREDDAADHERYQTVYAEHVGAIAAPTAGLHFTNMLLDRISARGIERASITLHVGPGTFRPVTAERAEDHVMDAEWYRVPGATARAVVRAKASGNRVVAVGTTVVRALESAALQADGASAATEGWTDLYIRPGHRFRVIDALVTNFHLPRSTLLLLVAALAGSGAIRRAYAHAIDREYRFYSYGDAMLIV